MFSWGDRLPGIGFTWLIIIGLKSQIIKNKNLHCIFALSVFYQKVINKKQITKFYQKFKVNVYFS